MRGAAIRATRAGQQMRGAAIRATRAGQQMRGAAIRATRAGQQMRGAAIRATRAGQQMRPSKSDPPHRMLTLLLIIYRSDYNLNINYVCNVCLA